MIIDIKKLLTPNKFLPIYLLRQQHCHELFGPVAAEIHWTSHCNYNCVHCSYGRRKKIRISLGHKVIQNIVDDLIKLGVKAVYLSGGGEPTIVQGWEEYTQQLISNNVQVALLTNSALLNDDNIAVLKEMNYVAVSVYAVDEDSYKKITRGNSFQKQFALPAMLKELTGEVIIGARCVLNDINYCQIVELYQKAMASGFDYIIFIPAIDYEKQGIAMSAEAIQYVKCIIKDNYEVFDFTKTNIDQLLLQNISHYAEYNNIRSSAFCVATQLKSNVFINYDGEVYLCQPHIGDLQYSIGNVNLTCFRNIWNSEQHSLMIEKMNQEFVAGLCKNCRALSFNKVVDEYISGLRTENLTLIEDPFV